MIPSSRVEDFAGAPGKAHLAAVIEDAIANPCRLLRFGVDMGDIRDVNRRFLLDDAAGLAGTRLRVALHHVDALDEHALVGTQHAQDLAALALVAAADHDDLVALLDLELHLKAPRARARRSS